MKKSSLNFSVKQFNTMVKGGTVSFDYPIQRAGGQWDDSQKSLLIHSLLADFPVPAIYSVTEKAEINGKEKNVYFVLDGKQRLTNITEFCSDSFRLVEDFPKITVDDGMEEKEYDIAEMAFSEMPEEVQDKLLSFSLQMYKLEDTCDEEIEELFFRLNNGTPLTKQQKARAKMGADTAQKVKSLTEHPFMVQNAHFTPSQIKRAFDESTLIQSMMLLDESYEFKSLSSNHTFDYSLLLKEEESQDAFDTIEIVFDYMHDAYGEETNKTFFKKVFVPIIAVTAKEAIDKGLTPEQFKLWMDAFGQSYNNTDGSIPTRYKVYAGAGSAKKNMVEGRLEEMKLHFENWLEKTNVLNSESKSEEQEQEVENTDEIIENNESEVEPESELKEFHKELDKEEQDLQEETTTVESNLVEN